MAHGGCQEGKRTPKLVDVFCPECKEIIEITVFMGGSSDKTGRTTEDSVCPSCGYVIKEGTPQDSLEKA